MAQNIACKEIAQDILVVLGFSFVIALLIIKNPELETVNIQTPQLTQTNTLEQLVETNIINSTELLTLIKNPESILNKETIIIDTRDEFFYQLGHVPYSINMPASQFDKNHKDIHETLQGAKKIIVYCARESCTDSKKIALKLNNLNYKNVFVYQEGFAGWEAVNPSDTN